MRFLLCCWCGLLLLFIASCGNEELEQYHKIEQLSYRIDSVGYPDYEQPIALRRESMEAIKSFLAAFPNSIHGDTLKQLHGNYQTEAERLLAEYEDFKQLKQLILAEQSSKQTVETAMEQLTGFVEKYPRCPMQNDLRDMNLYLQFLNGVKFSMPEQLNTLYDVNSFIDQCQLLLGKIINSEFAAPVSQTLNALETRRTQICESEIAAQEARMLSEMETYANGFFKQQCKCLQLPNFVKRLGGFENYRSEVKDTSRSANAETINVEQVFEYRAPHGILCRQTYLYKVLVKGVVQKSCTKGISYAIEPALLNEPVPVE